MLHIDILFISENILQNYIKSFKSPTISGFFRIFAAKFMITNNNLK